MNKIEQMLSGKISMEEFLRLVNSDPVLFNQLRELVPQSARDNEEHPLWKRISFDTLKHNDFDVYKCLCWLCRFDGSIADNLNIFATIRRVYTFSHPSVECTNHYSDAFNLSLDVIKDCFDGPEVEKYVEEVLNAALMIPAKGKRKKYAQEKIHALFHYEDKIRPRWIQGPEWPNGKSSPLKFCCQKRAGEKVEYYFVDVETGEARTVIQYF